MTADTQQELFNTEKEARLRNGRVRFQCWHAYLAGLRDDPAPLPHELHTGQVVVARKPHPPVQSVQPPL